MFKNNKDTNNYISKEEVEKIYENQKKAFDSKIAEQQKKINELTDYVSAKFGEDFANSNITEQVKKLNNDLKAIEANTRALKQEIEKEATKFTVELDKANTIQTEVYNKYVEILEKNENDIAKLRNLSNKKDEQILSLSENLKAYIQKEILYKKEIQDEFENTNKKINKINYLGVTSKFDKKIQDESKKINDKIRIINTTVQEKSDMINSLAEKILDTNKIVDKNTTDNKTEINKLKENFDENILKTNENISELKEIMDSKLVEEINAINANFENNKNEINQLIEKEHKIIDKNIKNNEIAVNKINKELLKNINQIEDKANINNAKLIEVENLTNKITLDLEQTKEFATNEDKKIEAELREQIKNNDIENKASLKSLEETIEDMKNTMSISIDNVGQEVLKLKEEAKANLEKQDSNNTDVELLKKEHNKYVLKINSELSKISKAILNMQKKNLETSNNLQIKIKAYIDNKIEKASNTKNVEELINKLQLSILEKEKLQKAEMEQMLNKKIKEIQKENERILNKKIEELNDNFIRNKATFNTIKEERYEELPKNKKNMYELIDNKQILKRSAANKNPLDTTKEGKSQILKFFYDDDNLN